MKEQKFGVEIELTGITRAKAADVIAEYFGTTKSYDGGAYRAYSVKDRQGRTWKAMRDRSIDARTKDGLVASEEYQTEIVTPVCGYDEIKDIQEILRQLRHKGAIANQSCGIHIHVDASKQTAQSLRNLVNIMASKEDLLFRALGVSAMREDNWCKKSEPKFVSDLNRFKPKTRNAIEDLWYNETQDSREEHYNETRYHALNLHSLWQGKGIEFRCFNSTTHAGKLKTYIQLCLAICNQAMTQKGSSARKTETTNEKYTFRTWLLRMGMIGDEFDTARKFLLENLNGDIAFRNGRPHRAAA